MVLKYKVEKRAVICTKCGNTFFSQTLRPRCNVCKSLVVVDYVDKTATVDAQTRKQLDSFTAQIQTLNNKIVKVVSEVNKFFDEYDKHVQINLDHVKQTDLHHDESQVFEKQVRSALARIKKTFDEAGIDLVK